MLKYLYTSLLGAITMKICKIKINDIPSMIWGEKSDKVFIAVHGNMSNKKDEVIKILANKLENNGYQLLSFYLNMVKEKRILNIYAKFKIVLAI